MDQTILVVSFDCRQHAYSIIAQIEQMIAEDTCIGCRSFILSRELHRNILLFLRATIGPNYARESRSAFSFKKQVRWNPLSPCQLHDFKWNLTQNEHMSEEGINCFLFVTSHFASVILINELLDQNIVCAI